MMKFRLLSFFVAFAALTPSPTFSQNAHFTNCHTPESSGNFVGPDETIVNGMICKVVRAQATQQPGTPAQNGQSLTATVQSSEITNARVVEMSKLGLDDEIIIARIKHNTCHFQLGDADLVELKKAGVSPKIIAAMLEVIPAIPAPPGPPLPAVQPAQPPTPPAPPAAPGIGLQTAPAPEQPAAQTAPPPAVAPPRDGQIRLYVTDDP